MYVYIKQNKNSKAESRNKPVFITIAWNHTKAILLKLS